MCIRDRRWTINLKECDLQPLGLPFKQISVYHPMRSSLLLTLALLFVAASTQGRIKAVWIPMRWRDQSDQAINSALQDLKKAGINRVYVDVWNNGDLTFKSPTFQSFTGYPASKDTLGAYVKSGRTLGIQVFAWFGYGFMSRYQGYDGKFAAIAKQKGLELGNANGFTWMHPTKSAAFFAGILIDAFKYGVNGVQFDDHFCMPPALPGSSPAVLTEAAKTITQKVKQAVPKAYISISPNPFDHHMKTCNGRWLDWAKAGIFDEYAPQMYHYTADAVIKETTATLHALSSCPKKPFIVAWAIDHKADPIKLPEAQKLAGYLKSKNMHFSIWYARGLMETYPTLKSSLQFHGSSVIFT
eukprot:TRINITY_DN2571_c0_g11_i1.p1 TRINITY_DN2571_c0_g11~~TRINITY_DN2571_c0_g11_i1.p1  ORF type:complete len:356 (-),score=73.50 TRINITY_DN2571_c0_g11_i1:155-1222(-)